MGRRGPQPTPPPVNELRGNPSKRPVKQGAKFPPGDCVCPDWLNDDGKAKWRELIAKLEPIDGLMKPAFEDMLALYCEAFADMRSAQDEIADDGATCVSEKGGAYQHPAVGRKNKAIQRMRQLGALFGLSPIAEAVIPGSQSEPEQDRLLTLLGSRSAN